MTPEEWLRLVRYNPVSFMKEAGFNKMTSLHNRWMKSFLFGKADQTFQAHRGSFKTTSVSGAIALLLIVRPDLKILFMRKTDDDVSEVIRTIKNLLATEMYQALSLALYGQGVSLKADNSTSIETSLDVWPKGTMQLTGQGTRGSLTGKHYDLIFTDDIINLEDRYSRAERERTKRIYQELQNIKNEGGRIINTRTPWHKDDAFTLMPNIKKFDCYSTGLMTEEEIYAKRGQMTPSLFAANYELKHISDEELLFENPKFYSGESSDIFNGCAHIDAAYGGGDYTAFSIVKKVKDSFLVFGKIWPKHVDDVLSEILFLHKKYRAGTIWTERNADKGYLRKELINSGVPSVNYNESMNKYIKISTHLYKAWDHVFFVKETNPDYIDQILGYNEFAEHDDAPDSLSSVIRRLTK